MPLMWRKDKHDGRGRIKICFIIFNDYVTNLVEALPSVRIAVLFAFRHTDIASEKSHGKPCAYRGK